MSGMSKLMSGSDSRPRGPQSREEFCTMIREFGNPFDKATWENKPKPTVGVKQAQAISSILKGCK